MMWRHFDSNIRQVFFAKMTIHSKCLWNNSDKSAIVVTARLLLKNLSTNQQSLIFVCVFISSNYFKTLMLGQGRNFNLVLFCSWEIEVNKPTKNIVMKSLLSIYCLLVFRSFMTLQSFLFSARTRIVELQLDSITGFHWANVSQFGHKSNVSSRTNCVATMKPIGNWRWLWK